MGAEHYAVEVMAESAAAKRAARAAVEARLKRYEEARERVAAGTATADDLQLVAEGAPAKPTFDGLRQIDEDIEDGVAKRLTAAAIAERDAKREEFQRQIAALEARNTEAWEDVAEVDRKHAEAVNEARRTIGAWEQERNAIMAEIRGREQQAKDLAARKDQTVYVDHVKKLQMRRAIEREAREQRAIRVETQLERWSEDNPKARV